MTALNEKDILIFGGYCNNEWFIFDTHKMWVDGAFDEGQNRRIYYSFDSRSHMVNDGHVISLCKSRKGNGNL